MSRDDSDIIAVRDLPPGRPEPTDESVSRTWHRITVERRKAGTRAPSRILVPAMAATLVAGLVVGGAVVFRPGGGGLEAGDPSAEKSVEPNLTPAPPETVAALNALADAAARGPAAAAVRPGQYIFVRHDGWAATFNANGGGAKSDGGTSSTPPEATLGEGRMVRQLREIWFDPQGMIAMSITDGHTAFGNDPASERAAFDRSGPSILRPTPEWLAALPTDPDELRARLRGFFGGESSWSTDYALWDMLQNLYMNSGLVMTPAVRAALLRSFTGLLGITSGEVTIAGRRLVAVRHTERRSGLEILFDPATGSAVGRRSLTVGSDLKVAPAPGAPTLDPGVTYQATWTQKVVDAVGAR